MAQIRDDGRKQKQQSFPPPGAGGGLVHTADDGEFPKELLKANRDFASALANCRFHSEDDRNYVVLLAAQYRMFNMAEELEDLTNFLNGSLSINMASRAQALQAFAKIFFPATSGMKTSKEELKYLTESVRAKYRGQRSEDEEEND